MPFVKPCACPCSVAVRTWLVYVIEAQKYETFATVAGGDVVQTFDQFVGVVVQSLGVCDDHLRDGKAVVAKDSVRGEQHADFVIVLEPAWRLSHCRSDRHTHRAGEVGPVAIGCGEFDGWHVTILSRPTT